MQYMHTLYATITPNTAIQENCQEILWDH